MFGFKYITESNGIIKKDIYDTKLYANIRESTTKITDVETQYRKDVPKVDILLEDLWAALYKAAPKKIENVPPSLKLNEVLLNEAESTQEWKNLRDTTMLDEWASALGAVAIGQKVIEEIPKEAKNKLKDAVESGLLAQKLLDEAKFLLEGAEYADNAKKKEIETRVNALKEKAQELTAKAESITEVIDSVKKDIRSAVKEGAATADELMQNANVFALGYSTGQGKPSAIESKKTFEIALKIAQDPTFRKIAEMAGRMVNIAMQKQKTKPNYEPQETAGITTGKDIQRLIATEYVYFTHQVLKREFYRKFTENNLLQYKFKGYEAEGRGPIVVCLDTSGSMDGLKSIWSRGVMIGLLAIAKRQKRSFAAIMFGSKDEIKVFSFPEPDKIQPDEAVEMARFAFRGGTDFETPLSTALNIIQESHYKKADLIFITDGIAQMSDRFINSFNEKKKEKKFKTIVVLMPGGSIKPLNKVADQIVKTEPVPDKDGEALDIMFAI